MVSYDILHNFYFLCRKAYGVEQTFCNGWAIFFLGLAVVVSVLLLGYLDPHIMQEGGGDDDIRVASWMILSDTLGMVENTQGMFDSPVVRAEVLG